MTLEESSPRAHPTVFVSAGGGRRGVRLSGTGGTFPFGPIDPIP